MNKVILMGRLTRDPDIRYSQGENQTCVARYTLAVDRRFKRDAEQSADFISCVSFGRTAEFLERYVKQGTKLCVEGRIQTGSYTDREGRKVYTTDVVVENAEFAESKAASGAGAAAAAPVAQQPAPMANREPAAAYAASAPAYSASAPAYSAPEPAPATQADISSEGFMNIADGLEDEGLPFN